MQKWFAERVMIGTGKIDENPNNKITIEKNDLINLDDFACVTMREVADLLLIVKQYLIWVWIEFKTNSMCLKFKKHEMFQMMFKQFSVVDKIFTTKERIILNEIDGIP